MVALSRIRIGPIATPMLLSMAGLLVLVVALVGRLSLFATHSVEMVAFPWQIDFDEGVILHSSWLLAQGHSPYSAPQADYFISSVYPPLFYVLNAAVLKLWGLNLWSGRAISLLGTLLAAGALVAWTAAETRSRLAGVVASGFWLALGPVIVWATFYKQDVLALGLECLGGAMLAVACPPNAVFGGARIGADRAVPRARSSLPVLAWASILPMVLAFWTKQSDVGVLAAGGLYLLVRDWRVGMRWCFVAGVVLIGPFLLVNLATHGQLYAHLVMPSAEVLSEVRLKKNMLALANEHWPLLIVGISAMIVLSVQALRLRRSPPLSVWYALCSLPLLLLTNLSPLANYNPLLDIC